MKVDMSLLVLNLEGCITYGDTIQEGYNMMEDAKKCWFTACIEDDIPIPMPCDT